MRSIIVALLFAACTTTMQFRVIEKGAYGTAESPNATVSVTKGDKESIIRLDLGMRPTGGWSIEPLDVTAEGDVVTVKAKVNRPAAGSIVTQALSAPYAVIAVNAPVKAVRWVDESGSLIAETK